MPQTVLFTYFELPTLSDKWFALDNMRSGVKHLGLPQGMEWIKVLGSGSDNGFGLWPNWGGYALLAAFSTEQEARNAQQSGVWLAYHQHAAFAKTLLLQPLTSHGLWDGQKPFRESGTYDPDLPTAVLTRARIKLRHLPAFWRRVSRVSKSIEDYPERTFSVGVGELPVIQQATVSHWTSGRAMQDYAYKSKYHSEVVKLTRQRGWYSEELFCRFKVLQLDSKQTAID